MALFKNLYLDLSYLNPFKYLKKKDKFENKPNYNSEESNNINIKNNYEPNFSNETSNQEYINNNLIKSNVLENSTNSNISYDDILLPEVSKKLLSNDFKEKKLPNLDKNSLVRPPPSIKNKEQETNQEKIIEKNIENKNYILYNLEDNNRLKHSYFKDIFEHLNNQNSDHLNKIITNKIYNPKLIEDMQVFWSLKKQELNEIKFNSNIKKELIKKLNDLHELETEWQNLQLQNEKISDMLFSKEILIENNVKQIKKLFKKLHLNTNVSNDKVFRLPNGLILNNLNELINNLRTMEDNIFFYHANENKNDFYNWIKDVYGFNDLAEQIKDVKNKEIMANIIEKWSSNV